MLRWSPSSGQLFCDGRIFEPWSLRWGPAGDPPTDCRPVTAPEALANLLAAGGLRLLPVAVIGPREASAAQIATAERVGHALGALRLPMLTGGRDGVMEAASRGCLAAGGQPIGLLPDDDWRAANDYVALPLATGLGVARNAIIARACFALIAVGGGYGTLSEMAYGMQFGRLVLAMEEAPQVDGVIACDSVEAAVDAVARRLFGLDPEPG